MKEEHEEEQRKFQEFRKMSKEEKIFQKYKKDEQSEFDKKEIEEKAKQRINELIRSLSLKSPDSYTLLVIDEVPTIFQQDWSDLAVVDNVDWLLALSPGGHQESNGGKFYEITPPSQTTTLSKKLLKRYRNCKDIRNFHNWWLEHFEYGHISLNEDLLADECMLPKRNVPIWIEIPKLVDDKEILNMIASKFTNGLSVTLTHLFPTSIVSELGKTLLEMSGVPSNLDECCKSLCWSYKTYKDSQGTEDDCVILYPRPYHPISPEHMARARKLLIIVTTIWEPGPGLWAGMKKIMEHQASDYNCSLPDCEYVGQKLVTRFLFCPFLCDGCGSFIEVGSRFKCLLCEDLDLCESCKASNLHSQHEMKTFDNKLGMVEAPVMTPEVIKFYEERAKQWATWDTRTLRSDSYE